jgi:hypothetical protein
MIIINNFEIINNGTQIAIDVETNIGFNITSILLWSMNDFKDYSLAKNLTYKLEQINNKEVIIVSALELNIPIFEDICFIEVESDDTTVEDCLTCQLPALGITYNLLKYKKCLLNYFFDNNNILNSCKSVTDVLGTPEILTISLLLDTIEKSIDLGYYTQSIDMIKQLKKICSIKTCNNCNVIECASCSQFKQY